MPEDYIDDNRLKYLLEKYLANSCSYDELEELLAVLQEDDAAVALYPMLQRFWEQTRRTRPQANVNSSALYQAVMMREAELSEVRRMRKRRVVRYRLASLAAMLVLLLAVWVVATRRGPEVTVKKVMAVAHRFKNDVKPGGNKAVLVLASGQSIVLDSAGTGTLAMQGGMKVVKLNNGQVQYRAAGDVAGDSEPVFNTISTPRGGQYELILQDGTKVWLNSETTLRFPTAFRGNERTVELSGEAYFEVAPHAINPFKIYMLNEDGKKTRKEIDVLGTNFNVMAYEEEKVVKTTLLEGAVRVGDEAGRSVLKPGQQAEWSMVATDKDEVRVINDADVDAAVAWKNGFFSFDRSDIRTIMRDLSRWYDLKVIYNSDPGSGKGKIFWGGIQKNLPLSDVLRILEKSGVEFSIDGNTVNVDM